jgi:branched-chain amino acid transport system permease protein
MRSLVPRANVETGVGAAVLLFMILAPVVVNDYWVDAILIQSLLFGVAAASLIFLSAYGGMVSLAQTALVGIAGFILGNMVTQRGLEGGETKGLTLGWDPTLSLVLAIVLTTAIGLVFGLLASRSLGIYFLMLTLTLAVIANYFFGQVTLVSGFSGIAGIDNYTPPFVGDIANHRNRLFYIALGVSIVVYLLIRFIVRTPFGIGLQGIRDDPVRMSSLGYNVPLHRALAFGFAAFIASLAGVLYVWWGGQISPPDVGLGKTIELLIMAVIGGLWRIEGAWLGAFAFLIIDNYVRDVEVPVVGGSFNTIIGLIFLAIVVVSPGGLMGLWGRITDLAQTRRRAGAGRIAPSGGEAGS